MRRGNASRSAGELESWRRREEFDETHVPPARTVISEKVKKRTSAWLRATERKRDDLMPDSVLVRPVAPTEVVGTGSFVRRSL
jgi:hypothetical protein